LRVEKSADRRCSSRWSIWCDTIASIEAVATSGASIIRLRFEREVAEARTVLMAMCFWEFDVAVLG
jgi:hypothetical protein